MQAVRTNFEQYNLSHHNFIEAYKMINQYVAELYQLPKKLVEDAGQALDTFCCEESGTNTNFKVENTCEVIIDFMDQVDEFTVHTIRLFNEHKKHVDETKNYIRKVSALKAKYRNGNSPKELKEYNQLAPELNNLLEELKKIKGKADDMVVRLEKLEFRWENIKVEMN